MYAAANPMSCTQRSDRAAVFSYPLSQGGIGMSLDNFVPRCSVFGLLVMGLGFALVLSSCAGQPNLGQASGASATANVPPTMPLEHPTPSGVGAALDPTEIARRQLSTDLLQIFYHQPGTILAHGTNQTPVGWYQLKTYRLEAVTLPSPLPFAIEADVHQVGVGDEVLIQGPKLIQGKKIITLSTIYRLTITGGPFEQTSLERWPISVGNALLGYGGPDIEVPNWSEVKIVLYDIGLLQEGSTLSLSGTELPEKLHFTSKP